MKIPPLYPTGHARTLEGSALPSLVTFFICLSLVFLLGGFGFAFIGGSLKHKREARQQAEAQAAAQPAPAPAPLAPAPASTVAAVPATPGAATPAPVKTAAKTDPKAQMAPKGEPGAAKAAAAGDSVEIKMGVIPAVLKYDKAAFSVKTGQRVKVVFTNNGIQPHNMLIVKPGQLEAVGALANAMMTDPQGMAKGYLPDSEDILWHTKLLMPQQSETIEFTAPAPAEYPYLCTFPGHWMLMRGVMTVTE